MSPDELLDLYGHRFTTGCMTACAAYRLCRTRHSGELATILPASECAVLPAAITRFAQIIDLAADPDSADGDHADLAAALSAAATDLTVAAQVPA